MKFLIIYHREDNDGVLSCAIMKDYIINELKCDDIDLLPSTYNTLNNYKNTDIDEWYDTYSNVVMLDISFNDSKKMKHLYKVFGDKFVWCDHHKPIIDASFTENFADAVGVRSTNDSTILNVWKYLYNPLGEKSIEPPLLYTYLSAWDSFTFDKWGYKRDVVMNVNTGFQLATQLDVDKCIKELHSMNNIDENLYVMDCELSGSRINAVYAMNNAESVRLFGDGSWSVNGESAIMLTACTPTNSIMFNSVKDKYQHAVVAKHTPNNDWAISVYNLNDTTSLHLGDYLKEKYNGGGHSGAAGMQLSNNQFIKILSSKKL